jgi:hypothetical protein
MGTITKGGIWLGILVVFWTFVMGFTGWYKDPVMLNAFWMVVLLQIGVLFWALRRTAASGNSYGKQLIAGLSISLIGGVIIFAGSLLFTTLVFPQYFSELRTVHEQMLKQAGTPDAQIKLALDAEAATATPFLQAVFGFIGTLITGLLVSGIVGLFLRKK